MELYNEETAPPVVKNSFAERLARMERKMERKMEEGIEKGVEQGVKQGVKQGVEQGVSLTQQKIVRKMQLRGLSDEDMMELMEITQEELVQLKSEI